MASVPIVIIDADGLIAQVDPRDVHHQDAQAVFARLQKMSAQVMYPVTAIIEAATYVQRILGGTKVAYGIVQALVDTQVLVAEVNQETLREAMGYFSPTTSKKNTLFDCVVAAVAEKVQADAIFSFDRFYKSKGFKLASEV